jgi:hypothetical protein
MSVPNGRFIWSASAVCLAIAFGSCRPATRNVKIAWDAPNPSPAGYRILVDDRVVMNIPPPPTDPSCSCLSVSVPVPYGQHTITVVAYNQFGESTPSAVSVVK